MAQIVIQTCYPCKPEVHVKASNRTTYMYLIKIRTHPKVGCWKSKGEGVLKSIVFKGKIILYQNWTFSRELFWGGGRGWDTSQKTFHGRGRDIFLEQLIYLISFQTNGSPGLEKCPTPPPTAEKGRMLTVV